MKRWFCFNTLARCIRTTTNVAETASAGTFDTAYVNTGITIGTANNTNDYVAVLAPFDNGDTEITDYLGLRFDIYSSGSTTNDCCLMLNGANNAYRIRNTATWSFQFQYWDSVSGAWVNWGAAFTVTGSIGRKVINLNLDITNGTFELYQNGVLKTDDGGTPPANNATAITELRFKTLSGGSLNCVYSQVMGADYSLLDSHMNSELMTANGTFTDGSGAYTDVDETVLNDGDAAGLTAVGQKKSFTHGAFNTLPAGLTIKSKGVNGRCRVGGTVSDGQFLVYSDGVQGNGVDLTVGGAYSGRGAQFETDPATGTNWVKADADAAEIGFEAV